MAFDVDRIRKDFPALDQGVAYFDGPGGTQVPRQVGEAIAGTITGGISNRGVVTAAERRAEEVVVGARRAVADLLGCDPGGVVFGRSMTQVTYDVSRALAKEWVPGDEVVVTRLDHDGNIRPWVHAAEAAGAVVVLISGSPRCGPGCRGRRSGRRRGRRCCRRPGRCGRGPGSGPGRHGPGRCARGPGRCRGRRRRG